MSPTRPESVDANAWWSPSDNEWIFGHKDDDDELHGTVTYWRPDGTLVNRCEFDHGYAHGAYVRYHPSGEISRRGTLVRGRIHGTDTFFRSESETTESFPSGLHAKVWRAELDMVNGSMVAGRLFDKEGRSVGEDGEPHPERPDGVPDDAVYSSQTGRWLQGRTENSSREGTWRFYAREGWLHQETVYDDGEVVRNTVYANAYESRATLALRNGDLAACEAAASAGLQDESTSDEDRLCLSLLRAQSLVAQDNLTEAVDMAKQTLATPRSSWGSFTATGKRTSAARAGLRAIVARDHLAHGRHEEALTEVREAIASTPRSEASLYVLKAQALKALGRDEERFAALKQALSIDDQLIASVEDDPAFAAWLESIHPESMTLDGAWEILGEAGEKLDQFCDVVAKDDDDDDDAPATRELFDPAELSSCVDEPWDVRSLPECSPELLRFAEMASHLDNCQYRSGNLAVCESSLTGAVQQMDAKWLGRIQSVFLPGSVVGFGQESLHVASWRATDRHTSLVYGIHQDDREYAEINTSLAAMTVEGLDLDEEDHEFTAPLMLRNRWTAAVELADAEELDLPAHLDLLELEPRTHWIVNLLVGKHPDTMGEIRLGQDIQTAASRDDWNTERALLQWPHLQAYWLMHHLAFGDHEALEEVLQQANPSYPGVAELVGVAKAVLAGEPVEAGFYNEERVLEYRMEALEKRPELLTEHARMALERDYKAIFDAEAQITAALEVLSADEANENLVNFLGFLRASSGKFDAYEQALANQDDKDIDYIMAMKNGRVTPFEDVFTNMLGLPDAVSSHPSRAEPLRDLFEAAVLRGSTSPDDHANTLPGALLGLGLLTVDDAAGFDTFLERVKGMALYPDRFGAYRRLQIAVLAAQHVDESASALEFLRSEVHRYSEQFANWGTDTFSYADRLLTNRGDDTQLEVLCDRLSAGRFSGANWKESVGLTRHFLAHPNPIVAPGLKAAVESGLGRHDDGDRATVVRAYARCAGEEASSVVDAWLDNIQGVRGDCEAASLLAGRIELDVGTTRIGATLARAKELLATLDNGSMEVGAGMSLLLAVHDHGLEGFEEPTKRFAALAEEDSIGGDELRAAIVAKAQQQDAPPEA